MSLRWRLRSWLQRSRPMWPDADEWLSLETYRGLATQAYAKRPLMPRIASQVWHQGTWNAPDTSLRSPARRERDNDSHHYGHDIQLIS